MRTLDEEFVGEPVGECVQEEYFGRLPVAAGATGLLIVCLERARHGMVHDHAHVRLVDAHAERVRGDDGADVAIHERRLHVVPVRIVQAGVVRERRYASALERLRHLLDIAARCGIDDGHARVLAQHADERGILVRVRLGGDHVVAQVGAVEARDDGVGVLEPELPRDVGADVRGGRGGERHHGRPAQAFAHLGDAQIAGPEVMAPLADAMRLIDGEERHADILQPLCRAAEVEALGGHVQHLHLAPRHAAHALRHFAGRQRAVDEGGGNAARREGVHLVLHERDERAHDDGDARQQECGHLVAHRLAAAGRQHDERVAT